MILQQTNNHQNLSITTIRTLGSDGPKAASVKMTKSSENPHEVEDLEIQNIVVVFSCMAEALIEVFSASQIASSRGKALVFIGVQRTMAFSRECKGNDVRVTT